jgi:hypothetical protein
MSEMVERVARAIAYSETADPEMWSAFVEVASAAIEAMREPTEAMVERAVSIKNDYGWRSMIDEALK